MLKKLMYEIYDSKGVVIEDGEFHYIFLRSACVRRIKRRFRAAKGYSLLIIERR